MHVERDDRVAKVWLDPVRLERSGGFRSAKLNEIRRLVEENQASLRRSWGDYFES